MEVKSYKCDICGEVYHVNPNTNDWVIVNVHTKDKGDTYEHLCPKCAGFIKGYILDPSNEDILYNETRAIRRLETCLSGILHKFNRCRSFWYGRGIEDPEYYDCITDRIIEDINDLERSRDRLKCAIKWLISISCVLLAGFIVACLV